MKTSVLPRLFSPPFGRTFASHVRHLRLVAPILLASCLLSGVQTARAGSATWKPSPANNDWNTTGNWTPETVPNGSSDIASFGTSNTTNISLSDFTQLSGITFNSGASAFTITCGLDLQLLIGGTGVTNNSGATQTFSTVPSGDGSNSYIIFTNNATAGNSTTFINNGGDFDLGLTIFDDNSSAGAATVVNNGGAAGNTNGGVTVFFGSSTAANGTFTTNGGAADGAGAGSITFYSNSSAGNALFTNNSGTAPDGAGFVSSATMFFDGTSTASNATITNNGGASSAAGGAVLYFFDASSAGNATLVANPATTNSFGGAVILFDDDSRGGTSRVKVFGSGDPVDYLNGALDISFHQFPGVTIGSIEGSGLVRLRSNTLTAGTNNLSTSFSGFIEAFGNGSGGFAKVGSGVLTFQGRTDDNYLDDRLTLSLVTGSILNLNFNGTDIIGTLIVDGVAQPPGLYGNGTTANRAGRVTSKHSIAGLTGPGNVLAVLPVAASRKIQGASARDIYLPMTGASGIECRSPGPNNSYQLIVQFLNPATFVSAGVTSGNGTVTNATGSGTNTATIDLANVTNAQTITVTLFRVNDGGPVRDLKVPMTVLIGDVNANRTVNASDVSSVKIRSGQATNSSNYRSDITANGQINGSDVAAVKVKSGTAVSDEYLQNFDTGNAPGFILNGLWHVTQNYPASGSYSLGFTQNETASTAPNGNYDTGTTLDQIAFSGPIRVPEINPTLSFQAFVGDEWDQQQFDFDRLTVWVSTDGISLTQVVASSEPYIGGQFIPEWFGPGSEQYNQIVTDLSGYNGQVIYLAFRFETFDPIFNNYPGVRIDDIHVSSALGLTPARMARTNNLEKARERAQKLRAIGARTREMRMRRRVDVH